MRKPESTLPSAPHEGLEEGDLKKIAQKVGRKGEVLAGIPWVPIGANIMVLPKPDTLQKSKGGIHIVSGDKEQQRQCIVVGVGPGEFQPYVGWVSPTMHYTIRVRDIVFLRMDSGISMRIDGVEYQIVRPEEITCRLKDGVAVSTRKELIGALQRAHVEHTELGEEAGDATTETQVPVVPKSTFEKELGEHLEDRREARGRPTKTIMPVDGNLPAVVKE